jgi:hypothetical protein
MSAIASGLPDYLSDPRMRAVRADACAALATLPAPLPDAALYLLDRIAPPAWTVEWYLPQWLGDAYSVPPEATHALILANVYGLSYIGLQDSLIDVESDKQGEPGRDDKRRTINLCLATALQQLWIEQYRHLFPAASPFWHYCTEFMHQWLVATLESNSQPTTDFQTFIDESYLQLAWRGAPLKICCAGATLLARREVNLSPLLAAIDSLLAAAVLLDHQQDWQEDLANGRYNAFVHFASPLPQIAQERTENRRRVLQKIVLERATAPYFDLVQKHLHRAISHAATARCPQLITHMQEFSAEISAYQEEQSSNIAAIARRTGQLLFGSTYRPGTEQTMHE